MSGPRRREPAGPRVLGRRDRRRGNVEIALVVEAVGDRGADQRHEAQSREPPDMPDERDAEDQADARQDAAGACVARLRDVAAPRHLPMVSAPPPLVPRPETGVYRGDGELIIRRRGTVHTSSPSTAPG